MLCRRERIRRIVEDTISSPGKGVALMTTSPAPTVVLVHGAFADASGFRGVIRELQTAGHSVVAPPNPLRSLAFDAAAIAAHVDAIDGPVVLVGRSRRRRRYHPGLRRLGQRRRTGLLGGVQP